MGVLCIVDLLFVAVNLGRAVNALCFVTANGRGVCATTVVANKVFGVVFGTVLVPRLNTLNTKTTSILNRVIVFVFRSICVTGRGSFSLHPIFATDVGCLVTNTVVLTTLVFTKLGLPGGTTILTKLVVTKTTVCFTTLLVVGSGFVFRVTRVIGTGFRVNGWVLWGSTCGGVHKWVYHS